jgi:hypothetical protein
MNLTFEILKLFSNTYCDLMLIRTRDSIKPIRLEECSILVMMIENAEECHDEL